MQVIYIVGLITDGCTKGFIDSYNQCDLSKPITIYINSEGGYTSDAKVIIDIINTSPADITLVASGLIMSAAFNIFFFTTGIAKDILPDTLGMAHLGYTDVSINEGGKLNNSFEKFFVKEMKKSKTFTIDSLKAIGLTTAELNTINAGKDCYFSTDRLTELLTYQIDNNGNKED